MHRNQYMWGTMWVVEHSLAIAPLNIYKTTQMKKRRKVWKKSNRFETETKTEDRGQSIPKSIGTLTVLRCIFGPHSEILTSICGDLSRRQSHKLKMGLNLTLKVKVNHPPPKQEQKKIGILTRVLYLYGPHLVILAWTSDELWRGQTWWRTDGMKDGLTDGQRDKRRQRQYPEAKTDIGLKLGHSGLGDYWD